MSGARQRTLAFVGCLNREAPYFAGARGTGLAVFDFDETTGGLSLLSERAGVDNPTFLTVDPRRRALYAGSEVFGWNEGMVSAFRIEPETGALRYINKQPSRGSITAHSSLDRSGRFLLVVNYTMPIAGDPAGESAVVLPLRDDGALGPAACSVVHIGSGPNASRQEGPHPHCILASPDNRFVLVSDLGIDKIVSYGFDPATGRLTAVPQNSVSLPPGSGPRHLAFHPNGRFLYVINELNSTIAALGYDQSSGALALIHAVPAVPAQQAGENHCADLHVRPDGRFLYGSNRGHDSIVACAIDDATGRLDVVAHAPSGGRTPRNFAIDPSGRFLIAANQDGDSLVVFAIDAAHGTLSVTGERINIGTPMCVKLARFETGGSDGSE